MNDMYNLLETIGNFGYTVCCFCVSHWNAIGGAILMILQAVYLIIRIYKKVKEK